MIKFESDNGLENIRHKFLEKNTFWSPFEVKLHLGLASQ